MTETDSQALSNNLKPLRPRSKPPTAKSLNPKIYKAKAEALLLGTNAEIAPVESLV